MMRKLREVSGRFSRIAAIEVSVGLGVAVPRARADPYWTNQQTGQSCRPSRAARARTRASSTVSLGLPGSRSQAGFV
jgi:hypothetical protein